MLSLWALSLKWGPDNLPASPSGPELTVSSIKPSSITGMQQFNTTDQCYCCLPALAKSLNTQAWILLVYGVNSSSSVSSARLCSLGQDTDSHLVAAVLCRPSVASKKNVSNLIFKSWLNHLFLQKTTWSFSPPSFVLFDFSSRLKNGLKEIFVYPAGMNIKAPELDSFLREVWTNHWNS